MSSSIVKDVINNNEISKTKNSKPSPAVPTPDSLIVGVASKAPVPEKPKQPRGHLKKTATPTLNPPAVGATAPKQPRGGQKKTKYLVNPIVKKAQNNLT